MRGAAWGWGEAAHGGLLSMLLSCLQMMSPLAAYGKVCRRRRAIVVVVAGAVGGVVVARSSMYTPPVWFIMVCVLLPLSTNPCALGMPRGGLWPVEPPSPPPPPPPRPLCCSKGYRLRRPRQHRRGRPRHGRPGLPQALRCVHFCPVGSTEAHQPRRDFTRAVHRIIDTMRARVAGSVAASVSAGPAALGPTSIAAFAASSSATRACGSPRAVEDKNRKGA